MKQKIYVFALLLWSLGPFAWQLYTSFCPENAISSHVLQINHEWTLENYRIILSGKPSFVKYLINSTIVAFSSTLLTLILAIPAAYSLNRINQTLSNTLNKLILVFALFPGVLFFLAFLEVAKEFSLGNNLLYLSIPYTGLCLPIAILLLYSAFKELPKELEEASKLEGFNLFQRLRFILLPIITPASSSTAIIIFLFSWNEYPISLTWISKSSLITLPVAIARIAGSSIYSVPYGAYAAATVLGSIPLILIVMIFQRQIVSGLTTGAIKG